MTFNYSYYFTPSSLIFSESILDFIFDDFFCLPTYSL